MKKQLLAIVLLAIGGFINAQILPVGQASVTTANGQGGLVRTYADGTTETVDRGVAEDVFEERIFHHFWDGSTSMSVRYATQSKPEKHWYYTGVGEWEQAIGGGWRLGWLCEGKNDRGTSFTSVRYVYRRGSKPDGLEYPF